MPADLKIEVIGKERVELDPEEPPLGEQRPSLLHRVHEVGRLIALRENDRLPAERSDLGAPDVEDVAVLRDIGEGHIRLTAHEPVAEPRPVKKERDPVLPADAGELIELALFIERSVLRRMGDVDHSREHHVFMVAVRIEAFKVGAEDFRQDLAVLLPDREHFISGILDGAGLVNAYVAGLCGDDPLKVSQHRRDDHRVRLGSPDQELHVEVLPADRPFDLLLRALRVAVGAVPGQSLHVGLRKVLQDRRMGACDIVAFK